MPFHQQVSESYKRMHARHAVYVFSSIYGVLTCTVSCILHAPYLAECLVSSKVTAVNSIMKSFNQPVLLWWGHYYTAKTLFISDKVYRRVIEKSIFLLEGGCLLTKCSFLVHGKCRRIYWITTPRTVKIVYNILISLLCEHD